jgi:alpha-D-xyloside xylohydrolase
VRQHALQTTDEPLEIRVYPGGDATFMLYEDDGQSNAYKQGEYSKVRLQWDESTKCLQIDKREGRYKDMPRQRQLKISVVGTGTKTIAYKGKKLKVRF